MSLMSMFPGGGGTQNQPLKAPTNLHAEMNTVSAISITWTDPENEYAQPSGVLIGEWMFTRIVRKEGSAPVNANDGELIVESAVKNQYQTNGFVDTNNIVTGTTYYYAAFAFTTSRVSSPAATYQIVATWYDPVLNNNSWTMIHQAYLEGVAQDLWTKGATKTDASGIVFSLEGYNPTQYALSDGSGYPAMLFVTKDIQALSTYYHHDSWVTAQRGVQSYSRSDIKPIIDGYHSQLSDELRQFVKQVNVSLVENQGSKNTTYQLYTFPLGMDNIESIYPTDSSRIKRYQGEAESWWLGDVSGREDASGSTDVWTLSSIVNNRGGASTIKGRTGVLQTGNNGIVFGIGFGKAGT